MYRADIEGMFRQRGERLTDEAWQRLIEANSKAIMEGKDVPRLRQSAPPRPKGMEPVSTLGMGEFGGPLSEGDEWQDYGDPGLTSASSYLSGLSAGNADLGTDDPSGVGEKLASSTLGALGMMQAVSGPTGKIGAAIKGAGLPMANALAGGLSFGAYNALHPADTAMERIERTGEGINFGLGLGVAHEIPGVAALTKTALGRGLYDAILFGGMEKAAGGSWEDSVIAGLGGATAAGLVHGSGAHDPRRKLTNVEADQKRPAKEPLEKTPAEQEVEFADKPRHGLLDRVLSRNREELQTFGDAATDPHPSDPLSAPGSKLLKGEYKRNDWLGEIEQMKAESRLPGVSTEAKVDFAKRQLTIEKAGRETPPTAEEIRIRVLENDFPDITADLKAGKIKDMSPAHAQMYNRALAVQGIGGGSFKAESATEKSVLRPMDDAERISRRVQAEVENTIMDLSEKHGIEWTNTADAEALGDVMRFWDGVKTMEAFERSPKGQEILAGAANPEGVKAMAIEAKPVLEDMRVFEDRLSKTYGGEGVKRFEREGEPGYLTKVDKPRHMLDVGGKIKDTWNDAPGPSLDGTSKGAHRRFNPYAKTRSTEEGPLGRERNFFKALQHRLAVHGQTAHTPAIHQAEAIADLMRAYGVNQGADAMSSHVQRVLNNREFGAEKATNDLLRSSAPLRAVKGGLELKKKMFNQSRYRNNPGLWFSQLMSLGPEFTGHTKYFAPAVADLSNPAAIYANREIATIVAKKMSAGGMKSESTGELLESRGVTPHKMPRKIWDAIMDAQNKAVEEGTAQLVANLHRRRLSAQGFTGRELTDRVSDAVMRWQLRYDKAGGEPFMSSSMVKGLFAASRWKAAGYGRAAEILSDNVGVNEYPTTAAKAAAFGREMGGVWLAGQISQALRGWGAVTLGTLALGDWLVDEDRSPLPANFIASMKWASRKFKKGDVIGGVATLLSEVAPIRGFTRAEEAISGVREGDIPLPAAPQAFMFGQHTLEREHPLVADPLMNEILPVEWNPDTNPAPHIYSDRKKRNWR